ncbi:hypothetical protein SAMN05428953_12176 [Mesorhizobium muleiense]|uniref:Uncharacterized protein n=1 Tax=Mesorhizobium muleiense TaxID=1004279 RepID=A0A1G9F535_9HYPH|nr:hypothetical protein SAMN05428953_12176 [Mesorhizobium muleiense]
MIEMHSVQAGPLASMERAFIALRPSKMLWLKLKRHK